MKTTNTIIAERNATQYFCLLNEVQAKKVLYVMTSLKGDQRLSDSHVAEARHIANFFDGVIQRDFAKELAKKFAEEFSKGHGTLLTKKAAEGLTEVNHRKILDALGHHGLDYVLTVLRAAKAYVANPANGIEEKHMLNALRWVERREDQDKEKSNAHHRKKGLELLGFGDMASELVTYSFIIANLYEQVTPAGTAENNGKDVAETLKLDKQAIVKAQTPVEMLVHFCEKKELVQAYIGLEQVELPFGYDEEDLAEGSIIYKLAQRGLLTDADAVLAYVQCKKTQETLLANVQDEFTEEELKALLKHGEQLKSVFALLANWN